MSSKRTCRNCGASLDEAIASGGLCPVCLMRVGLTPEENANDLESGHVTLPRTFAAYELLEELGRGGMGVVFAARQPALDRMVAVKLMLAGAYASEAALQRFRTEAAAAAGLQHPNIVEIHDYGECDGQPYYVMDLVEGRNLADVCGGRPIEATRAATMVRDLAGAVHYAHVKGVIHRDLKPSNVLLDELDRPRILDFGLAHRMNEDNGITVTGQVLGSPAYAAPEQAAGRVADVGVATDVYGLGALFYHLLTGRAPFSAATAGETLRLVLEAEPPPLRVLNASLPRDLETICLKCLHRDPARRYTTAEVVREDLQRFLENRPVRARPPSFIYRACRFARRHRVGVVAAAVVFVALLAGLAGTFASYRRAVAQEKAAEAARVRAQDMVTFLIQKLMPHLQTLGRRRVLAESAETAVRYFEQLPPGSRDRITVRAHATALDLLVEAYGLPGAYRTTTLDREGSLRAVKQAAALWRELAEANPADGDAMAKALTDEHYASSSTDLSTHQRHILRQRVLNEFRALESRFPGNETIELGLVRLLRYQGHQLGEIGRAAEGLACAREAGERLDRMLAKRPGDVILLQERILAWDAESGAQLGLHDPEMSKRCRKKGAAICERLLASDPTNIRSLGMMVILGLPDAWGSPSTRERIESIRAVRGRLATLMALDPEDPEWRFWDAFMLRERATAESLERNYREALESSEEAMAQWATLPLEFYDRSEFLRTVYETGISAADAGDTNMATVMLERVRGEFREWAAGGEPAHERARRAYHWLYAQAVVVRHLGDWIELERLARGMLATAEQRDADASDATLLPPIYRAAAQATLGLAVLEQGRTVDAVPLLEAAMQRFREVPSAAPFYEFPTVRMWETGENLARALQDTSDRGRAVEFLEWALAQWERDPMVGMLPVRLELVRCAWRLAQALDPADAAQAARRRGVLTRAAEILNDPETAPRLTPEEQNLRSQVAEALMDSSPDTKGTRYPAGT